MNRGSENSLLENLSECAVCSKEMRSARLLPCLHSACLACLQLLADKSQVGSTIACPVCGHNCKVPLDGVRRFPRNLLSGQVNEFLCNGESKHPDGSRLIEDTRVRGDKECVNSEDGALHSDVKTFCVDCLEYFCECCSDWHKKSNLMRDHSLASVETMSPGLLELATKVNDPPMCPQHPAQPMSVYCVTCQTPICQTCFSVRHKSHRTQELSAMAAIQKAGLITVDEVLTSIATRMDGALTELSGRQERAKEELSLSKTEITAAADKMCAMVRERQRILIADVTDIEQITEDKFEAAREDINTYSEKVSDLHQYVHFVQTDGKIYNTSVHAPGIQRQLRRLRQHPVQTINWTTDLVPQSGFFSDRKHLLGSVSLLNETQPFEDVDVEAKQQHIGTIKLGGLGRVSGVIAIHGHLAITHRQDPHIYLYNSEETLVSKLLVEGLINPCGMESDHHVSGRCVIIDEASLMLHWITVGHSLTIGRHKTRKLGYVPHGISIGHLGDVIVTGHSGHTIQMYSSKGGQLRELNMKVKTGMEQMAIRDGGAFVVLDSASNQVKWVNADGRVLQIYGNNSEEEDETMSNPSHMVLHPLGYLLIVDKGNSRIHLLGQDRKLHRYLLVAEDGLMKPDRVLWEPSTSLLYVAQTNECGQKEVKIFKSMPDAINQLTLEMQLFEQH